MLKQSKKLLSTYDNTEITKCKKRYNFLYQQNCFLTLITDIVYSAKHRVVHLVEIVSVYANLYIISEKDISDLLPKKNFRN